MDGASLAVEMAPEDPYLGKKILDQFRLVRVVGSGGMGVVYEGHDEGLGRRVAVKILHRDLVANKDIVGRFHREAQIAHQLDHPGIVRVVLFGQFADGNLYLVLEFLEGPTLMEALDAEPLKRFAPARAVKVVSAIGDAIGYAHARGIVHRDLKPENIILTRREGDPEFAKVLDFGIAKTLIGSGSFVTQTGLIFGTARYISPEGASGEPVDQRGDVYSLGVIAYQLLTGHTPFESDEPVQLLIKHMHEAAPPMRKVAPDLALPPALENVVMRALAKNPDARFDDGTAFARALREAAGAAGLDIRSIVPTTAMASFASAPVVPLKASLSLAPRTDTPAPAERASSTSSTPSSPDAPRASAVVPVSAVESSGVARVRTHSRSAERSEPSGLTQVVANGAVVAAGPSNTRPNLPPRVEIPAMSTVHPTPASVVVPPTTAMPAAPAPPDDLDEFDIPGLPKRKKKAKAVDPDDPDAYLSRIPGRSSPGRTVAVIFASVAVTVALAVAGAWTLRMFPSQRREDEIASLQRRANDAFQLGRYAHSPTGNDVEDLTDAVLALDPRNPRAAQLRRATATRLKAASDAERMAGHPERAVPILQDALRLVDDATLRDELAAAQREVDALRPAPARPAPPRPTSRPVQARPPTPGGPPDSSLVHPPQAVVPLNPAVTPTAPVTAPPAQTPPAQTPPVQTPPAQTPLAQPRPRRDLGPGNVLQSPLPPFVTAPPQQDPVSVFGPPQPPPDDENGDSHTGAF